MPRLIGVYEFRWYTPDDAPDLSGNDIMFVANEQRARVDVNNARRDVHSDTFRKYLNTFGPTTERTVCRKVRVDGPDEA